MKALWFFFLLTLVPSTLCALVNKRPDQHELDHIQNILDQANALQYGKQWQEMVRMETDSGLRDKNGKKLFCIDSLCEAKRKAAIDQLVHGPDAENYYVAFMKHRADADAAAPLYDQAIAATADAFDLLPLDHVSTIKSGPPNTTDPNQIPGHRGEAVVWRPKFSEFAPDNEWGHTDTAGHALISGEGVRTVARLAFALDHEGRHFRDITTPDPKEKHWNEPANEVRLREETENIRESVFGLTSEDVQQQDLGKQQAEMQSWQWRLWKLRGKDPYNKQDRAEFYPTQVALPGKVGFSYDEVLEKIKRDTEDLKNQVVWEAIERVQRGAPSASPPSGPVVALYGKRDLAILASKACLLGADIGPADLYDVSWFPGLPADLPYGRQDMSPCARDLFDRMISLNERRGNLAVEWVRRNAQELRDMPRAEPPRPNVVINLAVLADVACRNPSALRAEQMDGYMAGFPNGQSAAMDGPRDCTRDLYDKLIGFNLSWPRGQVVRIEWITDEAARLRENYAAPPPAPPPPYDDGGRSEQSHPYNHCIDPGNTCLRH